MDISDKRVKRIIYHQPGGNQHTAESDRNDSRQQNRIQQIIKTQAVGEFSHKTVRRLLDPGSVGDDMDGPAAPLLQHPGIGADLIPSDL